jgi:flagellar basal body rod protein FlgC
MKGKIVVLCFFLANTHLAFGENTLNVQGISVIRLEPQQTTINVNSGNIKTIRRLLVLAIKIAVNNIVCAHVTRVDETLNPFFQSFVVVHPDLSLAIESDRRFVEVYDPTNLDAQMSGDRKGYVKYPLVDVAAMQNDVERLADLLEELN